MLPTFLIKRANRYASQPQMPMGQMGGFGGMGMANNVSVMGGMGPNNGIAQAANAAQKNPNPLTNMSPGKHGLATAGGIQQAAQQAQTNNQGMQPQGQGQTPPAPTQQPNPMQQNPQPTMGGMMPKMGSLRAHGNWLEGLIPYLNAQVKAAEVATGGSSAPAASSSAASSGGQNSAMGAGNPGMGTPAGRPGSQNQQGNGSGGGGIGGGTGLNSQVGSPGSQIGAFGVVRPGWNALRPANSGFGGVTPPGGLGTKAASALPPTPGLTANQPMPPGPAGMVPPAPPGMPSMPPPNGGAPIAGTMGQPSVDPMTGQPMPPPGAAPGGDPSQGGAPPGGQPQPAPTQPDPKTGMPSTSPMQDPPPLPLPMNPRMAPPRAPTMRDNHQQGVMGGLMDDKMRADVPMNNQEATEDIQAEASALGSKTAYDYRTRLMAELALGTHLVLKSGFGKRANIHFDPEAVQLGVLDPHARTIHDGPPSWMRDTPAAPHAVAPRPVGYDPNAATGEWKPAQSGVNTPNPRTTTLTPKPATTPLPRNLMGRVPGGKAGLIMGAAGTLGGGAIGALAHHLFKKGSQDADGSYDTAKSATGESKGLKMQYKADHHAQGQEAWESVSQYFKGHGKRGKNQPNPSMGKHASVSTGTPGTHVIGMPASQSGFPQAKTTGTPTQPRGPIKPMGNPTPLGAVAMTPEKVANALTEFLASIGTGVKDRLLGTGPASASGPFSLPDVHLPKPDVGGLFNPETPKDAPGINLGVPLLAGAGALGIGYGLGKRKAKKKEGDKEAADYSDLTPFCRGFFEACDAKGVDPREAVEKVAADFPEAIGELREGMEKVAFKQWLMEGGKKLLGSQAAQGTANFGRGLFGITPRALPGTAGAFGARTAAIPTWGATRAFAAGQGTRQFGGMAGRQLGPTAGGALGGGFAGDDLGLGGDHTEIFPGFKLNNRGMFAGAAAANPFLRRNANQFAGGAASMPMAGMRNAWMGSLGGSSIDMLAGAAGYDTGGKFGRLGAQGAFGLGMARQGVRMAPNWLGGQNQTLSRLNTGLGAAEKGVRNFSSEAFRGLYRPLTYPVRAAANYVRGTPGTQLIGGTTTAAGRAGRLVGAGTVGVGGLGIGYGMAKDKITGDAREMIGQTAAEMMPEMQNSMADAMDQYMASRGMMDETGQFNPMMAANRQGGLLGGFMRGSDDIFRSMGMDPSKMSPLQKVMILGGATAGAGGMLAGAPAMAGVGGVSALAGLLPQLMPSQSQQQFNGPQAPYRPGQGGQPGQVGGVNQPAPNAPQARNEWSMFQQPQQPGM